MDSRLKEEFLTCIICHEVFRDPVTLHCGHTICSQCVTAFTKTQQEAIAKQCIPCPHCRALTKVPAPQQPVEQWAGQIKTGFFVKGLVEAFVAKENGEDLCTPCKEDGDNTQSHVWCSDCKKALCADCQKVHRKLMSTHSVTDLTDKKFQISQRVEEKFVCVNHRDGVVDMMCQTCDIAVCPRCCIESHKGCIDSVVKLVDALPKINKALENSEENLQHNMESLENEIPVLQSQVETLEEICHQAEADIDSFSQNISAALKEDLQVLKKQASNDLHEDIDQAIVRLQIAQQNKGLVKEVLKSRSDMARYEVYKTCQRSAEADKGQSKTSRVVKLQLQQQQQKTESKAMKQVDHITQIFEQRKSICQKEKACLVDTISAAADTDNTTPKLYDVIVLEIKSTTAVVGSDFGNLCVKCIYRVGEREKTCTSRIQFTKSPRSLTKISSTEIAVAIPDLKQIITFSVTPDLIQRTSISTQRSYHGLCFLPAATQFVALALLTGDVDIIDMSGVILRSLCPGTFVTPGRVLPGSCM